MHVYSLEQPPWWNCTWERANFWITGILFKITPCILLSVFMTMLVQLLLEAGRRRQRMMRDRTNASSLNTLYTDRTTKMLVLIMLVFLVTELPQGALVIALGIEPTVVFLHEHLGDILDLLSLINSTVNFVLYVAMSSEFRQQFALTFDVCSIALTRLCASVTSLTRRRSQSANGYAAALQQDTHFDLITEPVTNL
uniref:G-protein coupled receptors family 1 profile domain-containing protein n=1 Tax=Plectus sambesii TaxID=2011161 RepID=A0A914VPB2_9BILA